MNTVLRYLRKLVAVEDSRECRDRELLRRFIDQRDEAAFSVLVERHGPMVLGACRRVLRNQQDAEDVLQATFLVLARRASAIRRQDSVGSWLYGVAYRLALKLRGRQARQQECERQARIGEQTSEEMTWADLQPVLDEELHRLPEKYRAPILLCCLQGKSRDEAARELGWAEGAVKIRLERGREMLRQRLTRRGVVLSAALWGVLMTRDAATAALPVRLAATVVEMSVKFAASQELASSVPAAVLAMADDCLKTMALPRVKALAAVMLVACLGIGAVSYVTLAGRAPWSDDVGFVSMVQPTSTDPVAVLPEPAAAPARMPDPPSVTGILRLAQTADQRRVILTVSNPPEKPPRSESNREPRPAFVEKTYRLAPDAPIIVNGEAAQFADLQPGMEITLQLSDDQKMVVSLRATTNP